MRLTTGLKFGLVAALFYAAVRGSAAAWAPMEAMMHESVGWAAQRGAYALDMPGHHVLTAWKGENWAHNNPDPAALLVVALPMAALSLLGFMAGVAVGPGRRATLDPERDAGEVRVGGSLAVSAFALALAGTAGYGFLTGFVAVVLAFRAWRHLPRGARGRCAAVLAVLLGAFDSLAWIVVLVTTWHPRDAF
jgi:hypothetical protein